MIRFLTNKSGKLRRAVLAVLFGIFLSVSFVAMPVKDASATCCACCSCSGSTIPVDDALWIRDWLLLNTYFTLQFELAHVYWWDWRFWQTELLPAMMMMAEQLSAVGMQQIMMIGSLLDAQELSQTQRLLQEMHARAHKDYHPSVGMCEFGTRVVSLVASDRRGEMDAYIMAQRSINRMLGNANTLGAGGMHSDMSNRIETFKKHFCDPYDNDNALRRFCPSPGSSSHFNNDVDYGRSVAYPWTITADFGDTALTDAERDVMALGNNLYATDTYVRLKPEALRNIPANGIEGLKQAYLDMRSVVAKQSVAENSFNALMAMKQEGTTGSYNFLVVYLLELGVPFFEINDYLGEHPSYYAQMEILTKKAYQNPNFYTELYDTPANVERKGAAIEAISMIQKFDMLKSYLRTEASLSILLEMSVEQSQKEIEDIIRNIDVSQDKQ